jgi:hypothetical protein
MSLGSYILLSCHEDRMDVLSIYTHILHHVKEDWLKNF